MDPSSAEHHHHQEMSSQTLESMLVCTKAQPDKKPRPPEEALKCPRCDSTNTKFCYYNNYSLTQPRYFCKSCRRYWTKGGTLRNVPVGGGCRKNKRSSSLPSSSSSSSSMSSLKRGQDQAVVATNTNQNHSLTNLAYDHSDIRLAIASLQKQTHGHLGFDHDHDLPILGNLYNSHCEVLGNHHHGFFDALKGGFLENPHGFHNLYNGMNTNGNMGHVGQNGGLGINVNEDMSMMLYEDNGGGATTTASTVTAVKQEISCNARDGESRVLLGFPWQIGGEGNMGLDLDSGRQSWNNGFGSSWHGLLNSPLL